ncbi:MAG: recombinase family protein [Actinomycetota bacterium]|nr:recombinase family protein [Actinomycetota bacterium]
MGKRTQGDEGGEAYLRNNALGAKRAVLYARVSTDEQAKRGYSLAQQLEALRAYAASEGYEVLEEVVDAGQSGASLERPGMDRVRDLVAAGGVSVVLAQDRDRFAREPAYAYLLRRELEEHGCKLRALNDRGDDSPEGQLTDGILDQLAKYERAKITERTRRGKLRKAREGKVIGTHKSPYGFRYANGAGIVLHDPEMEVLERIFRWAAEGLGSRAIQGRLMKESIPSPSGMQGWSKTTVKRLVLRDTYLPRPYEEIAGLVSPEVAATLNPEASYGIRWWNRSDQKGRQISEPNGEGGRRYRRKTSYALRDPGEWVAVPVPTSPRLPLELVERARESMSRNRAPERTNLTRPWQLRGIVRCSCGSSMSTHTATRRRASDKMAYHYYRCNRNTSYMPHSCGQRMARAEEVEEAVWTFVSEMLCDPERVRAGVRQLAEQERAARRARLLNPEKEASLWAEKVSECARKRSAYQDQQAAGLMTLAELSEKLADLEETRRYAEGELTLLRASEERAREIEEDGEALVRALSSAAPEAIRLLPPEDRSGLYERLNLEVTSSPEGYRLSGMFCTLEPSCS